MMSTASTSVFINGGKEWNFISRTTKVALDSLLSIAGVVLRDALASVGL
jgi:hypothetical protein